MHMSTLTRTLEVKRASGSPEADDDGENDSDDEKNGSCCAVRSVQPFCFLPRVLFARITYNTRIFITVFGVWCLAWSSGHVSDPGSRQRRSRCRPTVGQLHHHDVQVWREHLPSASWPFPWRRVHRQQLERALSKRVPT